jgi:hypothetical protein
MISQTDRLPSVSRWVLVLAFALTVSLAGCQKVGCLEGDNPECTMPSPCKDLEFSCEGGSVSVRVLAAGDAAPGGMTSLAATGDVVLSNDLVTVVLDAIEHPHYLAPTGGAILDMTTAGADNDSMRHTFQASGVLPDEAAAYTDMRIIEEEGLVAVQFLGTLDGRPDMPIATRYEMRPCEPGIRIRSELANKEVDAASIMLSDGYYLGNRELLPFTPTLGRGFDQPSFGLGTLGDVLSESPYLVTAAHAEPAATYSAVACSERQLSGFQSTEVAANGAPRKVVMPRDYVIYERFIGAAAGAAVSVGADIALEVRRQLWGEEWVTLSGQLTTPSGDADFEHGLRASVLLSEGSSDLPPEERTPWTQAAPDAEGRWTARVPAGRNYVVEVESYGKQSGVFDAAVAADDVDLGTLEIPDVARLQVGATVNGVADHVLVFVHPADDATAESVSGEMFSNFNTCAPLLGNPHGSSPACNMLLVNGEETVGILPGVYDVFASVGPFSTLAAERGVVLTAGSTTSVTLELASLDVQPEGTLSADFHVHGGASFDSNFPDYDRVRSFLASGLEVIAATDHDAAWDYAEVMNDLSAHERLRLLVGTENTGHILFKLTEDSAFPKVVGHWNIWPLTFDPEGPYRGAAWDEKAEPGTLMQRAADSGWPSETGVVQLNHPIGGSSFGRDYSWGTALELDLNEDLKADFDGSLSSLFHRQPAGSNFSNSDYHAQELMNGTNNGTFLQYRAFWHYLLNQGVLRAATANSDTHTLAENVVGTPRTLVQTSSTVALFDEAEFNASVRDGRMTGTNGPVLSVSTSDVAGAVIGPSLTPFQPAADANLKIRINGAPWVPVEEVRVLVNGQVVRTLVTELSHPSDPLGTEAVPRLDIEIPLAELLPSSGDAWLVVEAGHPLEPNLDLNCDGIPDTGDNNRDGLIDWQDVDDPELTEPEDGVVCLDSAGPLTEPAAPTDRDSTLYLFRTVVPGGYPLAFTNPLLMDREGDGYSLQGGAP